MKPRKKGSALSERQKWAQEIRKFKQRKLAAIKKEKEISNDKLVKRRKINEEKEKKQREKISNSLISDHSRPIPNDKNVKASKYLQRMQLYKKSRNVGASNSRSLPHDPFSNRNSHPIRHNSFHPNRDISRGPARYAYQRPTRYPRYSQDSNVIHHYRNPQNVHTSFPVSHTTRDHLRDSYASYPDPGDPFGPHDHSHHDAHDPFISPIQNYEVDRLPDSQPYSDKDLRKIYDHDSCRQHGPQLRRSEDIFHHKKEEDQSLTKDKTSTTEKKSSQKNPRLSKIKIVKSDKKNMDKHGSKKEAKQSTKQESVKHGSVKQGLTKKGSTEQESEKKELVKKNISDQGACEKQTANLPLQQIVQEAREVKEDSTISTKEKLSKSVKLSTSKEKPIDIITSAGKTTSGSSQKDKSITSTTPRQTISTESSSKENKEKKRLSQISSFTPASEGASLFVVDIPDEIHEKDLFDMFTPHGKVIRASIARDSKTKVHKGYGFITMADAKEALQTVKRLNGHNVHGKSLLVSLKRSGSLLKNALSQKYVRKEKATFPKQQCGVSLVQKKREQQTKELFSLQSQTQAILNATPNSLIQSQGLENKNARVPAVSTLSQPNMQQTSDIRLTPFNQIHQTQIIHYNQKQQTLASPYQTPLTYDHNQISSQNQTTVTHMTDGQQYPMPPLLQHQSQHSSVQHQPQPSLVQQHQQSQPPPQTHQQHYSSFGYQHPQQDKTIFLQHSQTPLSQQPLQLQSVQQQSQPPPVQQIALAASLQLQPSSSQGAPQSELSIQQSQPSQEQHFYYNSQQQQSTANFAQSQPHHSSVQHQLRSPPVQQPQPPSVQPQPQPPVLQQSQHQVSLQQQQHYSYNSQPHQGITSQVHHTHYSPYNPQQPQSRSNYQQAQQSQTPLPPNQSQPRLVQSTQTSPHQQHSKPISASQQQYSTFQPQRQSHLMPVLQPPQSPVQQSHALVQQQLQPLTALQQSQPPPGQTCLQPLHLDPQPVQHQAQSLQSPQPSLPSQQQQYPSYNSHEQDPNNFHHQLSEPSSIQHQPQLLPNQNQMQLPPPPQPQQQYYSSH